jgi:protein ImuA
MQGVRHKQLQDLRDKIAALETGPALRGAALDAATPARLLQIPAGTLSEVFASGKQDGGAALGFSLALARGLLTRNRPGLIVLQLADDAQKMGLPYGPGLAHFGLAPDQLVFSRPKTIVELLWAMEEAIACRAVAAVVADIAGFHKALDFTASRRLSLRSAASGAGTFIVRYTGQREASAARFRWNIAPALSDPLPFDDRAPGSPRWRAVLEKGRLQPGQPVGSDGEDYLVDWTRHGFVLADIDARDRQVPVDQPPLPGPEPAALGDRLPQAG